MANTTDIYSPGALVGVIERLDREPLAWVRDRYFREEQFSTDEHVHLDLVDGAARVAPYVNPRHQSRLMEERGYETRTFVPPYVKPKSEVNPDKQFKRRAGEPIGPGSMTPDERRALRVREILQEHEESVTMREEVQCVEQLRTGRITVTGPGYGTIAIDLLRHAELTVTLGGTSQWGQADAAPLTNIRDWAKRIRTHSGAVVRDVVLSPLAASAFLDSLSDKDKEVLFNFQRSSGSQMELGPRLAERLQYLGRVGNFDFWEYDDTYVDVDGTEKNLMPAGELFMAGTAIRGTRAYGAIRDPRAGYQSLRTYPKNWIEEDPANEYIMTQSAPLMFAKRANASFGAKVA